MLTSWSFHELHALVDRILACIVLAAALSSCNMLNPPSTISTAAMHRAACEEHIRAFGVAMPKPVTP